MHKTISVIICTVPVWSLVRGEEPKEPLWKRAGMVEQAVRLADAAFLAELEWYEVDRRNDNVADALGRVVPTRMVWGHAPAASIETGPQTFVLRGGSVFASLWHEVSPEEEGRVPIVLLSSGIGPDLEVLHVVRRNQDKPERQAQQLPILRSLEYAPDSPHLREELVQTAVDPAATEMLWSYALRRLYRLEEDPERRFDLVLHPRIQESAPYIPRIGTSGDRLGYAIYLLTRNTAARPEDYYRQPSAEDLRQVYSRLVDAFVNAPSEYLARAVIIVLNEQRARQAEFSPAEWDEIRRRIREAVADSQHAIHQVDPEMHEWINERLERLLGEPSLLRAQEE